MCADTSQAEAVIPPGYGWDLSGLTDYEKYSCVAGAVNCACSGRALECTSDSGVSTTPNAPQCSLQANCSYSIEGDRVVFDYFVLNARGVVSPTPSRVSELITNDGGPISGTRQFTDSFDGTTALATCEFPNDSSITEEVPKDPKIVSFIATPIVEQGRDCRFSWTTQDMSSCSLGGEDFGVQNSAGTTFGTSAGRNITKTLTCTTDEGVDSVQRSLTKTCFVRPTVTPF